MKFKIGDKVRHTIFGQNGIIVSLYSDNVYGVKWEGPRGVGYCRGVCLGSPVECQLPLPQGEGLALPD
jgi:hypothetical protein